MMLALRLMDQRKQLGGVDFDARHVAVPVGTDEMTVGDTEGQNRLREGFERDLQRGENIFPAVRASRSAGRVGKRREDILVLFVGQTPGDASTIVQNPNETRRNSLRDECVDGLEAFGFGAKHDAVPFDALAGQFGQNRGMNMAKQSDLDGLMKSNDTAQAKSAQEFKKVG